MLENKERYVNEKKFRDVLLELPMQSSIAQLRQQRRAAAAMKFRQISGGWLRRRQQTLISCRLPS